MKQVEFARYCNRTQQAVSKACKPGKRLNYAVGPDGRIDVWHWAAIAYKQKSDVAVQIRGR